ncbi:hypothetical protein Taro_037154 [Colocasia esculenta]|uniref:non-specific serine/threonine protein kinase n=1 Tax=Colocasia esculenta TaxID=4460 RepID=A0A843WFG1_COLES|nr:hypothetical protein [Colocasia esculenta]
METGKRRPSLFLKKLHITPPSTFLPSAEDGGRGGEPGKGKDHDFSDVFGPDPAAPAPPSSSSSAGGLRLEVIHARSHSLVGPSPRVIASSSFKDDAAAAAEAEEERSSDEELEEDKGGVAGDPKMGTSDFDILRVVGRGAFGKVFLVRKKKKGCEGGERSGEKEEEVEVFAMKVMKKETIINRNQVEYMRAERDILTKITHPFIIQLRYSFQKDFLLFQAENQSPGTAAHTARCVATQGNSATNSMDIPHILHLVTAISKLPQVLLHRLHLSRHISVGSFLGSEDQARFYTAEIVSAVSHLHSNGIVHRDLKPENILMDADGHVMLTDFGLAKEIDESNRSNSLCGTTEYMAPEIILSKGHNKDADWWSIGILLFEMLTGQPPFTHPNRQKLQQRIIKEKVKLPSFLSSEAHSLLKGLLQKDPTKRLGSGQNGGDQVKVHRWFKQINWKKLEARELKPKFKPDVSGRDCTANFDQCWTSIPPDDSPAPTPTSDEHFHGYSYVAPNPWANH